MNGKGSTSMSRARACFGLAVILAPLNGCLWTPTASYRVTVQPGSPTVAVTLELRHPPRNGVTLRAFADQAAIGLSGVVATDGGGRPVPSELHLRTIEAKGKRVQIPSVSLPPPLPDFVRVQYRVAPTRREGDDHLGFTGTCFGEINDRFAVLTGRNVFIVPEGMSGIRTDVHFTLPAGWSAETTWKGDASSRVPWSLPLWGRQTTSPAEALVSGVMGLGQFRQRSFEIGRTRYHVAVERSIPRSEETKLLESLERATRFIHRVFLRAPGTVYRVIATPPAASEDEIAGEGSSWGQGGTLVPITPGRLRLYADRLISAYVLYPPSRTTVRDPREYWLVDAVRSWYAWRATVEAGLLEEYQVTRQAALAYLAAHLDDHIERNIERMYDAGQPNTFVRSVIAPAALQHLDHVMAQSTARPHPVDRVISELFRGRSAPSIWTRLPRLPHRDWTEFRDQYVRGRRRIPVERWQALEPTHTRPPTDRAGGKVLSLAYTGDTRGFLENCGCKVNQSGGVARRARKIAELRRRDPEILLVDAGSALVRAKRPGEIDTLSRLEQGLYLRTMEAMGYAAVALGTSELALGIDHFRAMTRGIEIPFLSSNAKSGPDSIAPAATVVERAGIRIGIIGVLDPPRGDVGERMFEQRSAALTFEDPVAALRREVGRLRPHAGLVVVLGRLDPHAIRRVIRACPGIDVILSLQNEAPTLLDIEGDTLVSRSDVSGFFENTLVLYVTARQYGLDAARLHLDADGHVTAAEIEDFRLGEDAGEDREIRAMLDRFYDRVGRTEAAQASVTPPFSWDPQRTTGQYVGSAQCASCHAPEFRQWTETPHAGAFKTLLEVHRHYQPRCVSCHVVGFGTPHGYKLGTPRETLANVQCEVCHGPGGSHVTRPTAANIQREVPERICVECHNPEHSDGFVYAEKLPLVRHLVGANRQSDDRARSEE